MKDSPVKKLDFNPENKENMPEAVESFVASDIIATKPVVEVKPAPTSAPVAKTIKELEAEEPLLRENPHRFVLFPYNIMVRILFPHITRLRVVYIVLTLLRDLEHVQARGSFILDC